MGGGREANGREGGRRELEGRQDKEGAKGNEWKGDKEGEKRIVREARKGWKRGCGRDK